MITIYINKNIGKPGYWMNLINEETMRDELYLRFNYPVAVSTFIDTLSYTTLEEIDLINYAWEDWKEGTSCCKKPKPSDYEYHRGN